MNSRVAKSDVTCHRRTRRLSVSCIILGLCILSGCGGLGPATVEGIVTYDGEPVEAGMIVFEPADGAGPVAGGMIENGKYRLDEDGGVPLGKKIVRITGVRKTGRRVPGGFVSDSDLMVDEVEPFIPDIYGPESTLAYEVTAGPNKHNLELVSP